MTPAEQAARDELAKALKAGYGPIILEADEWRPIADHMLAAIEQARRQEREACAMIADAPEWDWHSSGHGDEQWPCLSAQTIAAAIRARAQDQP